MATLEVHDGQGRVQFIELARSHPLLFGASASCDVVLEGAGVKPVHGRIRWKSDRFKVEASPDAEFVVINGHRMAASSINQGDEIEVGPCRMFLLRVEDDPESVLLRGPRENEGRTRVVPPPIVSADSRFESGRRESRPSARTPPGSRAQGESMLERGEWLHGPKAPSAAPRAQRGPVTVDPAPRVHSASPTKPAATAAGWTRRIARLWPALGPAAPGRERIATSPVVLGLIVSLAVLVGMGLWLRSIITATVATRTYNRAVEDFENGDYRTAIRDFDAFVKADPEDPRVGKARVLRALANVRQYVSPGGATWSNALQAAQEMLDQVGGEPAFRDQRVELSELVLRTGEALADRARQSADPKALAEAESAVPLHAQVAGEPAVAFLNRSRLPVKLAEARAAVRKSQIRSQALAVMDKALTDGSASRVYQARDDLVEQYSDLAHDRELIARMTAANELIRRAVSVDKTPRPASRTPRPDPLGPATSVILRTRAESPSAASSPESIVWALADGFVYAIEGTVGAPLWQLPVGLASPFVPQAVPGDATVLAFDARFNDLLRLDARTGTLIWRLELAERVLDPPLVLGNQLAQVLPSGRVAMIALKSGELQATVNLGRPLARMPVHDELGRHLYVVGRQDCLFILSRDPLSCAAVEYLGHVDGSVACPPARLGRFLVIPENDSLNEGRWHVLVLDEDGARVRPAQELKVTGWTWQTPTNAGSIIWAIGDQAGFEAFAIGDYASPTPFRPVARLTADSAPSGPAFALARSERELWSASGHPGQFLLDPEHGSIEPKVALPFPGPALAPIQAAGRVLVATFQDRESGGVALWGIDPDAGTIVWRTIVGAPWPIPLATSADSDGLTTIGLDGHEVRVSKAQVARGGFIELTRPHPGDFTVPAGSRLRLVRAGKPLTAIVPQAGSNTVWVEDPDKYGGWRETTLPTSCAADPLAWEEAILIPGRDNRLYLIDPVTARSRAEPYVPRFDRDRQGIWLAPVAVDRDTVVLADDAGRVRRISLKTNPVPRLTAEAETILDQRIVSEPASTGNAILVATADRRVRSLAARDLSPVGAWALEAPLAERPTGLSDGGFVSDRSGGVMAFGRDGQRIWSIKLSAAVVGSPQVLGQSVVFLTRDGFLHVRARSDGSLRERRELGILPAGGPLVVGHQAFVSAALGTIRPVVFETSAAIKP
jgi:outer membrane protein assembly factor BamB